MKEEYEIKKSKDLEILKWTVTSLRATVSFKQDLKKQKHLTRFFFLNVMIDFLNLKKKLIIGGSSAEEWK